MSILPILKYPNNRLRKIAKIVNNINHYISEIINCMIETMYHENGIGLAATQIDIHLQIIVINLSQNKGKELIMINPKILEKNGLIQINEGCLSIPGKLGFVSRYKYIKVIALDNHGNQFELNAKGLLAVCIQHEIDHLIGKLFIDYFSNS